MLKFTQAKIAISDSVGADTIVINIDTGTYYSLTPAGAEAWAAVVAGLELSEAQLSAAKVLCAEGLLESNQVCVAEIDSSLVFDKYTDMESLLIADPIHEVDEQGWPKLK
jgi:hypothetical protein